MLKPLFFVDFFYITLFVVVSIIIDPSGSYIITAAGPVLFVVCTQHSLMPHNSLSCMVLTKEQVLAQQRLIVTQHLLVCN